MGLPMMSRVWRYERQRWTFRPMVHQGNRLHSYNKDPALSRGFMVAADDKTLLLKSPGIPLDHRALAGLSPLQRIPAFPPRLHLGHLCIGQKTVRLSILSAAIDIGLRFLPLKTVA